MNFFGTFFKEFWSQEHVKIFTRFNKCNKLIIIIKKKATYFFIQIQHIITSQKDQEASQKHMKKILGIFNKSFEHKGVQIARNSGKNSNKTRKHAGN